MAHRKPLGTTCRTHCHWTAGPPPDLGDCLRTPSGTTYLVVGVEETDSPDRYNFTLERIAEPPEDATVYPFKWNPRRRKRRVRR